MTQFGLYPSNDVTKLLTAVTIVLQLFVSNIVLGEDVSTSTGIKYGVDISWPMHHMNVSTNYPWLPHNIDRTNHAVIPDEYKDMPLQPLGNINERHEQYINGCIEYYGKRGGRCRDTERDRITMTLRQPQSMKNYTANGFTKIRAPDHVFQLLKEFWDKNHDKEKPEKWFVGNIYTNHWESPSAMVSVEDTTLEGGGYVLKQHIWNAARDTMQAWTGYRQAECSLYGIRIYKSGAMLAPHVDRLPLVSSAIINVAQDVDEPWPLEVIGHDGFAHNVTMLPGDMVLYESHSVIHGRQFPLKGRFMANVFIHFEPVGPIGGQVEYTGDLPPYLLPGSPEESNWRERNPDGHKLQSSMAFTTGSTELHTHAAVGDVESMQRVLNEHESLINVRDSNGWTALHEAVRHGNLSAIEFLLNRGAEVNARTGKTATGGSVLWHAIEKHGPDNDLIQLLKSRGAELLNPVITATKHVGNDDEERDDSNEHDDEQRSEGDEDDETPAEL